MVTRPRLLALRGLAPVLVLGLGLGLGLGGRAAAGPGAAEPPVPWADWVGDYTGALAWRGCSAPGAASAAISLDAVDAVMSIDLVRLGGGLRALSLVEVQGGWSAQQGDVRVSIARPKPSARSPRSAASAASAPAAPPAAPPAAIDLLVELDSGCTVRGRLQRAATGVPACDRLIGWTRIEARCGKLSQQGAAPLEDAALVAKTKWRAADAERCAARAAKVELSLTGAGCAPYPDPAIGTRAPDCLRLADDTARVARCKSLPRELEVTLVQTAHALRAAAETADRSTLGVVEQQCRDARATVTAIATRFHCPLP